MNDEDDGMNGKLSVSSEQLSVVSGQLFVVQLQYQLLNLMTKHN